MRDAVGTYRHVVLLGGTSEIGQAIVRRLVAEGTSRVTLLARDAVSAKESVADCAAHINSEHLDLGAPSSFATMARKCGAESDIDLVIVAVGMLGDADQAAHDPVHALEIIGTTFSSPAALIGAFADVLVSQGHGSIVVLSSVAGYRVRGENHVYGAAKAGLDGFAQGLAQRLHGTGVDVLIARPGFVHTRMTKGMDAAPFSIPASRVAEDVTAGLQRRRAVVWSPAALGVVMAIVRHLPARLLRLVAKR